MKKAIIMSSAIFAMLISMIISIQAHAESYPECFFYSDAEFKNQITEDNAVIGDVYVVRMIWHSKYAREGYLTKLCDESGTVVGEDEKEWAAYTGFAKISITINTTDLQLHPGRYTVYVTKKYCINDIWYHAPTESVFYINFSAPQNQPAQDNSQNQVQNSQNQAQNSQNQVQNNNPDKQNTKNTDIKQPGNIKGLTVKNKASSKLVISYKKSGNAKKYKIQFSTDKKFKKNIRTVTTSKTKYTISKLKKGKTYYVRVRSVNGKKQSAWSKVKKVKIKK